jgi:hypothetical protein
MNEHYLVAADHGHLRIFAKRRTPSQATPALAEVDSLDFPAGKTSYTGRDTDVAGRFPSAKMQGRGIGAPGNVGRNGMSIDERLPMQREEERRRVKDIGERLEEFFRQRPEATWELAAGPELITQLRDGVSAGLRSRLRRTIAKDLVNQSADDVRAHFSAA